MGSDGSEHSTSFSLRGGPSSCERASDAEGCYSGSSRLRHPRVSSLSEGKEGNMMIFGVELLRFHVNIILSQCWFFTYF